MTTRSSVIGGSRDRSWRLCSARQATFRQKQEHDEVKVVRCFAHETDKGGQGVQTPKCHHQHTGFSEKQHQRKTQRPSYLRPFFFGVFVFVCTSPGLSNQRIQIYLSKLKHILIADQKLIIFIGKISERIR